MICDIEAINLCPPTLIPKKRAYARSRNRTLPSATCVCSLSPMFTGAICFDTLLYEDLAAVGCDVKSASGLLHLAAPKVVVCGR